MRPSTRNRDARKVALRRSGLNIAISTPRDQVRHSRPTGLSRYHTGTCG
ncbi:MAG TPA: hypothetical protein VFA09_09080 [Ktedonobacteraceae bacterium]|nr:hypothetical protein [Ktedonobacteraceae bacterium]